MITTATTHNDEITLTLIAHGLVHLASSLEHGQPLSVPYPESLQQALDRMTVAAWQRGDVPPHGIPELLHWCAERPLSAWPFTLPDGAIGAEDQLLTMGLPSQLCLEWAMEVSGDIEASLQEERLMEHVLRLCREQGRQDAYVAFRELLINRPVLRASELLTLRTTEPLTVLIDALREAYAEAPEICVDSQARQLATCGRCGNLLRCDAVNGWASRTTMAHLTRLGKQRLRESWHSDIPNLIVWGASAGYLQQVAQLLALAPQQVRGTTYTNELAWLFHPPKLHSTMLTLVFSFQLCPICNANSRLLRRVLVLPYLAVCLEHQIVLRQRSGYVRTPMHHSILLWSSNTQEDKKNMYQPFVVHGDVCWPGEAARGFEGTATISLFTTRGHHSAQSRDKAGAICRAPLRVVPCSRLRV